MRKELAAKLVKFMQSLCDGSSGNACGGGAPV